MQFYANFYVCFSAPWKLTINDRKIYLDLEVMLRAQISDFKNRNFIECSRARVASKKIFEKTIEKSPYNANIGPRMGGWGGICMRPIGQNLGDGSPPSLL